MEGISSVVLAQILREVSDTFFRQMKEQDINDQEKRKKYIEENQKEWFENGQTLKARRKGLGLSIRGVARRLNTSPSRISSFESGNPIQMASGLNASCKLLYEHTELKNSFRSLYKNHDIEGGIQ